MKINHQLPDYEYVRGFSEIIPNQLYIAGEDDVDQLLYGKEEARHLNSTFSFKGKPDPQIDCWIDCRDIRKNNRQVYIPKEIEKYDFPFKDGDYESAKKTLPKAKEVLKQILKNGKRVLVTCHEGRSRSVLLVLYLLAEEKSFLNAYLHLQSKRPIMNIHKNFQPFLDEWKKLYPSS